MSSLLLSMCWLSLATAWFQPLYDLEDAEIHFERFIQQHERQYADEDDKQSRFQIFKENLEQVNRMNEAHGDYVFGITQFMDLTIEEFRTSYTGLKAVDSSDYQKDCTYLTDADIHDVDAPESFDWRDQKVVTSVKNQIPCGSCYAFSSIGNIESQYAIKHKQLIDLSVQQIIDCDKRNSGCHGGYMSSAFRSLIEEGGSEAEDDYPYRRRAIKCQFDASKVKVNLTDCHSYNLTSQEKLKQLLYHNGPIAIAIRADGLQVFYRYKQIIMDKFCHKGEINHAVLLVGYGTEGDVPYWIVKNSWGIKWGNRGYFRMQRGETVESCGMMNDIMATSVID